MASVAARECRSVVSLEACIAAGVLTPAAVQVAEIEVADDFDWTSARPVENDDPWVMRDIPAGLWVAIQAAAIAFVGAWLLLKLCELFWWFLMDRLRDVANAVRKS